MHSTQLWEHYPELFQEFGKLKEFQIKLHNCVSISLSYEKKVAAALETLGKQEIIERVEGPMPYASPVVIIPKTDGDVRICLDMRLLNKAIQREWLPSPIVDDLINSLNGATNFFIYEQDTINCN